MWQLRCGSLHDGKFCAVGLGLRGLVSAESGFLPTSFDRFRMSGQLRCGKFWQWGVG